MLVKRCAGWVWSGHWYLVKVMAAGFQAWEVQCGISCLNVAYRVLEVLFHRYEVDEIETIEGWMQP